MTRDGKICHKRKRRNGRRVDNFISDDSDEDYNLDEDEEFDDSDDDYCSLAEDESQDSLEELEEEEDEWIERKDKKVGKPRGNKDIQGRRNTVPVKPRKKKTCTEYFSASKGKKNFSQLEEERDDSTEGSFGEEKNEVIVAKSCVEKTWNAGLPCTENAWEEEMVDDLKQEEDSDDDTDYEDDEEFIPSDDMETIISEPKIKQSRKKKPTTSKQSRPRKKTIIRKKKAAGPRKSIIVCSESDFEVSGSSEHEYTISEEERESIREAYEICGSLAASSRSSALLQTVQEEEVLPLKRNRPEMKEKQKMVDSEVQIGSQVCGICLSEEGKRTVIGVLNCCTHYFCFACIMEWSKIESRCPLCKQRFGIISKTVRSDGVHDSVYAVYPIPERDQVYQPSEEELRGYLEPYENVICTECLQGGDDALMLLCDICDSPTHTYCVGLGREVPDGNWYCDGCRPASLVSLNSQAPNPTPGQGEINLNSAGSPPANAVRESFDLNEAYVPETPQSQFSGYSQWPQTQATSPPPGFGPITVDLRRRILRQIYQFRNRHYGGNVSVAAVPRINLLGSIISPEPIFVPTPSTTAAQRPFNGMRGDAFCSQSSTSGSQGVAARNNSTISGMPGHQRLYL